ncbi:MAG: hypothetical protein C0489_06970 [Candidatus Accumulibacter sp.]|nr:hypothetical protein [Accumulibacter sp.]
MGFFDWIFGGRDLAAGNAGLMRAVDRVLHGIDPRLKLLRGARDRLAPAVQDALAFARETIGQMPPSVALTPENWAHDPLLRATFARPDDIDEALAASREVRHFIDSGALSGGDTLFGVLAATRVERSVLGSALDGGGMLRRDVLRKTVSFGDFRVAGLAPAEAATRRALEDFVLEQLALAAMREIADNRKQVEHLESYRQLLLTRLRLMEQSGAGLDPLFARADGDAPDLARLRRELALNAEQLAATRAGGAGLEGALERVLAALRNAEAIIRPQRLSLNLDAMNIVVPPQAAGAPIELLEFSTVDPERPRRVAFLVSFPRGAVHERHVDLDALRRSL